MTSDLDRVQHEVPDAQVRAKAQAAGELAQSDAVSAGSGIEEAARRADETIDRITDALLDPR